MKKKNKTEKEKKWHFSFTLKSTNGIQLNKHDLLCY